MLSARDEGLARVGADPSAFMELFSRVLSPNGAGVTEATRWDVRLPWNGSVRDTASMLCRGPLGDALLELSGGADAQLWECAAVIVARGAAPQILHGDTMLNNSDTPEVFTAFVALQDIAPHMGPTRFVPRTHAGPDALHAHDALAEDPDLYCASVPSVLGLLNTGEVALFDSRLLHAGGPYTTEGLGMDADAETADALPERVLFTLSFLHEGAAESMSNVDKNDAGSIRPEVAARGLTLGQIRGI